MRTLVVLPTHNEAENVLPLVGQVMEQKNVLDILDVLHVLVVDDASPDGTGDLVAEAMATEPRLHLIRREAKLGLGGAYVAGFHYGVEHGYDLVVTMDGDFSHHPRYLPSLVDAAARYDLVIGSRYVRGGGIVNWPIHRRMLSAFANLYVRVLLRLPVRDCTSGFRGYRREVLESVDVDGVRASGYSFLEEMVWRVHHGGFRIGEIPIVFEDRHRGVSKIDRSEIFRAVWHVLATAFRSSPPPKSGRMER